VKAEGTRGKREDDFIDNFMVLQQFFIWALFFFWDPMV
jgi:hypothetical protein